MGSGGGGLDGSVYGGVEERRKGNWPVRKINEKILNKIIKKEKIS